MKSDYQPDYRDPGVKWIALILGLFSIYFGVHDLVLDVVELPTSERSRRVFEWLNVTFGMTHSYDYFEIFAGSFLVYLFFKLKTGKSLKT